MIEVRYLLDSNICIYVLEGSEGHAPLRLALESLTPGAAVTSAITYAEVLRGRRTPVSDDPEKTARFFATFPVIPFDEAAARRFADVPFRRGKFDHLIAAHALSLDLTLVTANERDFADMPGLRVENWTQ